MEESIAEEEEEKTMILRWFGLRALRSPLTRKFFLGLHFALIVFDVFTLIQMTNFYKENVIGEVNTNKLIKS
jgi:hypothetical protein